MGTGHGHGHGQGHAGGRHRWRLAVSFVLIGGFFVVELVFGLLSGSLSLLSDAGHMAADVVTLGAALVATRIATRPDTTGRRSYGSYRAEIF
ncbi:cation transporter, partial [Streptosporangium sandarakinum]|uniref:cation transporter n=1 Tax=Streptosporangium sandarakinum TaxID=1260955 RepID=UPI0033B67A75